MKDILEMKTEALKKAFEIKELQEETYLHGFFSGKATKYFIPESNLNEIVSEFPFLRNAITAGLIFKDKKTGKYYTTDKILAVKNTDKKKRSGRQFFSISGEDNHERTTLYDALVTVNNLKFISEKFGVTSDEIKFSVRYENGNPDKVLNYVELDKNLFGNTQDEIINNIQALNNVVKYERKIISNETVNA